MRSAAAPLLLLAFLAVLVHGYHLGADDAAIYVPAIKHVADPRLYPFGSEFFLSHARLSLFPDLVGATARLTRLPVNLVIFLFHVVGVYLLLLASWQLLRACFLNDAARWSGVFLLAACLSVPVAGTALVIMDPYLTARSLSTPFTIFAIACYVSHKPNQALAWLILTALVHPQMSAYCIAFLVCLWLAQRVAQRTPRAPEPIVLSAALPFVFEFQPV